MVPHPIGVRTVPFFLSPVFGRGKGPPLSPPTVSLRGFGGRESGSPLSQPRASSVISNVTVCVVCFHGRILAPILCHLGCYGGRGLPPLSVPSANMVDRRGILFSASYPSSVISDVTVGGSCQPISRLLSQPRASSVISDVTVCVVCLHSLFCQRTWWIEEESSSLLLIRPLSYRLIRPVEVVFLLPLHPLSPRWIRY